MSMQWKATMESVGVAPIEELGLHNTQLPKDSEKVARSESASEEWFMTYCLTASKSIVLDASIYRTKVT